MTFDDMDIDFNNEDDPFDEPFVGYEDEEFGQEEYEMAEEAERSSSFRDRFDFAGTLAPVTENPLYTGIAALVVGLLVGLLFAYVIWPVQYINASPENLHPNYQLDYMRMVIDSYNLRADNALAKQRIDALGEDGPEVMQALIENPGDEISRQAIQLFGNNYNPNVFVPPTEGEGDLGDLLPTTDAGQPAPTEGDQPQGSRISTLLLMACAVTGVLALALGGFWFYRMRNPQPVGKTAAMKAQEFSSQAEQTDYESMGEKPIAQWMTTYLVGDDLFDDSFSIDSMSGEFLGECGVGIADTIGVGEPKRVSAFEVWLFDKNDIQTVTNVLVSQHASEDDAIMNKLKAKGEPYLATEGKEIEMLTKTLRMVVKVMDMQYGTGHLPEESFFQRITLELAVWELKE